MKFGKAVVFVGQASPLNNHFWFISVVKTASCWLGQDIFFCAAPAAPHSKRHWVYSATYKQRLRSAFDLFMAVMQREQRAIYRRSFPEPSLRVESIIRFVYCCAEVRDLYPRMTTASFVSVGCKPVHRTISAVGVTNNIALSAIPGNVDYFHPAQS